MRVAVSKGGMTIVKIPTSVVDKQIYDKIRRLARNTLAVLFCIVAPALLSTPSIAASIAVAGKDAGRGASRAVKERCIDAVSDFKMSAETFLTVVGDGSKPLGFCGALTVYFSGDIDTQSMATLRKIVDLAFSRLALSFVGVELNSDGGDVWEALSFAKFIREHGLRYMVLDVPEGSHCYSSCVFILAGGFQRGVEGDVGIHRPYFTDARVREEGYKSMQQAYDALFVQLKSFLISVNISDRLVSDMWLVTSDRLRVLTDAELDQYGLSSNDTVFTELQNAQLRSACGESAPAEHDDYLKNVLNPCDRNGIYDYSCINERGRKHPYCHCIAEANPNSGFICD